MLIVMVLGTCTCTLKNLYDCNKVSANPFTILLRGSDGGRRLEHVCQLLSCVSDSALLSASCGSRQFRTVSNTL